ncbi:MAG: nitroreductase family protein [Candidatus Hydrogenedentes bacterium]|nr:nitroreductase family protein [Candidatus Hydrogenedentota bacterium]
MSRIAIAAERCSRCGTCVAVCPALIFERSGPADVPAPAHESLCIACGHCVAACPADAIAHAAVPPGSVRPLRLDLLPSTEQVVELLRQRRSIRVFDSRPIERAALDAVLDAAGLAPSGHNMHNTECVVVQDPDMLRRIAELCVAYYTKAARQLRNPLVRMAYRLILGPAYRSAIELVPELELMQQAVEAGHDIILRGAPCAVICHAEINVHTPEANAQLALYNATLVGQTLGLGSCLLGWIVGACLRDKAIPRLLGIPDSHRVYGGLALGYPKVQFSKWIERNPLNTTWL